MYSLLIRAIFKNMKKSLMLSLICLFLCLYSCQATPEDEAIVEKKPIVEIAETVTEENVKSIMPGDIPERWDEEIEKPESNIKIIFRTEIDAPEEAEIAIEKYETGHFDDDMLQKHLKYLLGEEYDKVKFLKWPNDVKQGYIDELIAYKRGTEVDGRIVTPPEDDPYIKELEEYIAELPDDKDEYVEPVLDYDIPYDSSEYRKYKSRGKNYFSAKIIGGKYDNVYVHCLNYIPNEVSVTSFSFNPFLARITEETLLDPDSEYKEEKEKLNKLLASVSLNEEDSINQAYSLLEKLYSDNYTVAYCKKAVFSKGNTKWTQEQGRSYDGYIGGYLICFVPQSNNTLLPYSAESGSGFRNAVGNNYSSTTTNGSVIIAVTEEGIAFFSVDLKRYSSTVSENIELLRFGQIQERIRKLYDYNSILDKGYGVDRVVIEIDRMILRMTYTRNEGDESSVYTTPVWCVYGKYHMYKENGELYGTMDYNMMINAIDGSNMGS